MARDDQSNKSFARSSYEKISRATFGSLYRVSNRPMNVVNIQNPPPPSSATTDSPTVKLPLASHIPSAQAIPIESINPPPEVKPNKWFVRFSSRNVKKAEDGGGQKTFSEEKYNRFIERTKMRMRAASSVSGGRSMSRRESFNDMVSSYISRTKMRLTSLSSDGKAVSSRRGD